MHEENREGERIFPCQTVSTDPTLGSQDKDALEAPIVMGLITVTSHKRLPSVINRGVHRHSGLCITSSRDVSKRRTVPIHPSINRLSSSGSVGITVSTSLNSDFGVSASALVWKAICNLEKDKPWFVE